MASMLDAATATMQFLRGEQAHQLAVSGERRAWQELASTTQYRQRQTEIAAAQEARLTREQQFGELKSLEEMKLARAKAAREEEEAAYKIRMRPTREQQLIAQIESELLTQATLRTKNQQELANLQAEYQRRQNELSDDQAVRGMEEYRIDDTVGASLGSSGTTAASAASAVSKKTQLTSAPGPAAQGMVFREGGLTGRTLALRGDLPGTLLQKKSRAVPPFMIKSGPTYARLQEERRLFEQEQRAQALSTEAATQADLLETEASETARKNAVIAPPELRVLDGSWDY